MVAEDFAEESLDLVVVEVKGRVVVLQMEVDLE